MTEQIARYSYRRGVHQIHFAMVIRLKWRVTGAIPVFIKKRIQSVQRKDGGFEWKEVGMLLIRSLSRKAGHPQMSNQPFMTNFDSYGIPHSEQMILK